MVSYIVPSCSCAQLARRGLGIKRHPGLFQYPSLDFFVVKSQQFQRPDGVMLFSGCTWLMALNLCHQAHGYFTTFELFRGGTYIHTLSKQMGNSAAMIERQYSKLTATMAADKWA